MEIETEVVKVFDEQFREEGYNPDYSMLDLIPAMIMLEENDHMTALPCEEEVKEVIFQLSGSSAAGPDDFTGLFFQYCWEIMVSDVTNMVKAFFCGEMLPRYITHTNLVLLPKKEEVKIFSDLRSKNIF